MTWLLTGIVLAPIIHWAVRRTKFWGVHMIIAGLVFAPGLCITAWLVWFFAMDIGGFDRWRLIYLLEGVGSLIFLAVTTGLTVIYLGVWGLLEYVSREAEGEQGGKVIGVVRAWPSLLITQLLLTAIAVYLHSYTFLGRAVSNDNFTLAEKRLNWNLEGLGPNNGLIVRTAASELELFPLLPVAVRNGNYDMVQLLLKHGAELNPKDWDKRRLLESGYYVTNTLYFAVKNQDVEMIDYLIDLGVNPEQGIHPALLELNRDLLRYFLDRGVSLEFALGVAVDMGWTQQKIDEFFPELTPKIRAEAGQ